MRKCVVASGVLIEKGKVLMIRHKRLGVYIQAAMLSLTKHLLRLLNANLRRRQVSP